MEITIKDHDFNYQKLSLLIRLQHTQYKGEDSELGNGAEDG